MDSFFHSWIRHGRFSRLQLFSGCHSFSLWEIFQQITTFPSIHIRIRILGWNTEQKLIRFSKSIYLFKLSNIAQREELIFIQKVHFTLTQISLALSNINVSYFLYTYRGAKKPPWFYLLMMAKKLSERENGTNNSSKRNLFDYFIIIFPSFPSISLDWRTEFYTQSWVLNYQHIELLFLQFLVLHTSKIYSIFHSQNWSEIKHDHFLHTRSYNQQLADDSSSTTSWTIIDINVLSLNVLKSGVSSHFKREKAIMVPKFYNIRTTVDRLSDLLHTYDDIECVRRVRIYVALTTQVLQYLLDSTALKKPPWSTHFFDRTLHCRSTESGMLLESFSIRHYNE